MIPTPLLQDLGRAFDLLQQVDEADLDFAPDPKVSADIREQTGLESYPTESHRANLQARIDAVASLGDKLDPRAPSDSVARLIVTCVKLAPPSDGSVTAGNPGSEPGDRSMNNAIGVSHHSSKIPARRPE